MSTPASARGFTLIEMLVVLMVMGLFVGLVSVVTQPDERAELRLEGLAVNRLPGVDRQRSNFDLTLWLRETAEGLKGVMEYNADLFDAATIAHMAEQYLHVLEHVVADPGCRLASMWFSWLRP